MRKWYVPSWSGDFRLEATGEDRCALSVLDPTVREREQLAFFLEEARKRDWIDKAVGISPRGKSILEIEAGIRHAGPVMATALLSGKQTWTAFRSEKGQVTLADEIPGAEHALVKKAEAAVTTQRPAVGCPQPEPCSRRASEVLRVFSTRSQWAEWQRSASMSVVGRESGRLFRVFHRDAASRRGMRHVVYDPVDRRELCVWNDLIPAEEEVLSIKLALEHRERSVNWNV